jgi:DNA replicative helicase MCM subunit Mcm2 (Cdc46/Mcm family)
MILLLHQHKIPHDFLNLELLQKWTNLKRQEIAQLIEVEGKAISVTLVDPLLNKHYL